jgi:nucleotide-binding universal stress UspA family protein
MQNVLACIDASAYAAGVCDLAAWASQRLELPVELLHVVQRKDGVAERRDLSGAIGLGVKTDLLEELTRLEAADARFKVEQGRALLSVGEERLREAGATEVRVVHRHGGIVETILERESDARVIVIGKRGADHEFASDHIGSTIERVVRASAKPVIVASRTTEAPQTIILAYDSSPAANRALERLANSPLFAGLSVHIVMAGNEDEAHRRALDAAAAQLPEREVNVTLRRAKAELMIANVVEETPRAMLVIGAYGHSPLRTLMVGSTTTEMIRTVHAPVLLVR